MRRILFAFLILPKVLAWSEHYTVTTKNGPIGGTYYTGKTYAGYGKNYVRAFYGIEYAEKPMGNNAFEPPRNITPFSWKPARALGYACTQSDGGSSYTGYADCLYLNIYTPWPDENTKKEKLPVMVWIHGGSFNTGSGSWEYYGADYLVEEGVILVTVNYRLGVYGFLSAPHLGVYGNMGLKDQRAALRWVNENIEAFGGDKDRITIFGESAGAASVHYLLMDKSSRGLYQRAILQSGSAFNPWASQFKPEERFNKLTEYLKNDKWEKIDINTTDGLKKAPPRLLMPASLYKIPNKEDKRRATDPIFNPVIEDKESPDPIINRTVEEIMKEEGMPDVDIMMGFNSAEGLLAMKRVDANKKEIQDTLNDIERVIPRDALIWENPTGDAQKKVLQELKTLYTNNTIGENTTDDQLAYVRLMGDAWFEHGIYRALNYTIKTPNRTKNTYFYKLSDDSYSVYKDYVIKNWNHINGVCHTDDLGYIFRMQPYYMGFYINLWIPEKGKTTHRRLITMWTNFAKTGDPMNGKRDQNPTSFEKTNDRYKVLTGVTWDPVRADSDIKYLEITKDKMEMKDYEELYRMQKWDEVYKVGLEEHEKQEQAKK